MFALKKIIEALLLPPTGPLLLILLGLWLARRRPRLGRGLSLFAVLGLWVLSMPIVGHALLRSLERYPPIPAAELTRVDAIVVLGGGAYRDAPEYGGDTLAGYGLERVRYAAWLYHQRQVPILVTGGSPWGGTPEGAVMKKVLETDFVTPVHWAEIESRDTQENAVLSAPLLRAAGVRRIALLSHGWHLPRAIPLFEAQGFEVVAAPTVFSRGEADMGAAFLPGGGLNATRAAMHEYLGILAGKVVR